MAVNLGSLQADLKQGSLEIGKPLVPSQLVISFPWKTSDRMKEMQEKATPERLADEAPPGAQLQPATASGATEKVGIITYEFCFVYFGVILSFVCMRAMHVCFFVVC